MEAALVPEAVLDISDAMVEQSQSVTLLGRRLKCARLLVDEPQDAPAEVYARLLTLPTSHEQPH